jgi:SagB-type dehydrogenase family enzyme
MHGEQREVRRARSLLMTFADSGPQVCNFLQNQYFNCNAQTIAILAKCGDWQSVKTIVEDYSQFDEQSVAEAVSCLVRAGGLVARGSTEADRDEQYSRSWEWQEQTAFQHFGMRDVGYYDVEETVRVVEGRRAARPSPPLYDTNDGLSCVHPLERPDPGHPVFRTMLQRRSRRRFASQEVPKAQLGDCLFAGLGITGFVDEPLTGRLPLKPTPSGGARNPYEAFVLAQRVGGMARGLYHYSAAEHSLGLVSQPDLTGGDLLAGQDWATSAAAIVILVAHFERTMWKYAHPKAYRIVLFEAGHIAQNMALAATAHGLNVTPTAALAESVIERAIGLDCMTASPVYALAIGIPGAPREPHSPR